MMLMCLVLCFLLILCWLAQTAIKPKGYPPGPTWFPILGCYKQVKDVHSKKNFYHLVWAHMQKIYGSVVGLKLGSNKIVIVSGYEAVQQTFLKKEFEGRPDGIFFRLRSFGGRLGVVFVDGAFMREQRKFCLYQLRQVGFGKATMNDVITKEALEIVNVIMAEHEKGPIEVLRILDVSALNTIWTLLAGERFSINDKKLSKLLRLVNAGFRLIDMTGGTLNKMPFLRFVAPSWSGYNCLKEIVDEIMEFLQEVIKKHGNTEYNSFISMYLQQIQNNRNKQDTTFTEKQLLVLLEDLFMAGTETTSNTLAFVIFYLVKYPHVQKKIHRELDKEVGFDQIPSVEHRDRLTYLEATIMEAQRHGSPVPLAVAHRATQDTVLMDYKIPKDTIILPSLWSVHMEKSYWKDPEVFKPERFIDPEGKLVQDPHFMPFGIGRRRCIGEILAKTSMFLFLSIILQKFKVEPSSDCKSFKVLDGATLSPSGFKVMFIPRK